MMFGRFTERAQKVLALAQEEALRLGGFTGLSERRDLLAHRGVLRLESLHHSCNLRIELVPINVGKRVGFLIDRIFGRRRFAAILIAAVRLLARAVLKTSDDAFQHVL